MSWFKTVSVSCTFVCVLFNSKKHHILTKLITFKPPDCVLAKTGLFLTLSLYLFQPSLQKASDSASEADGPIFNAEGMQYVDAKSYMLIEISLHRPLVPKRQPDELAKRYVSCNNEG